MGVGTLPSAERGLPYFAHMDQGPDGSGYNNADQTLELLSALGNVLTEHKRSFPDRLRPTDLFRPPTGANMMERLDDEPRDVQDGSPEDLLRTRSMTTGYLGPKSEPPQLQVKRVHTNMPLSSR